MCFSNTDILQGRTLYHVTPLHYIPQILARGGLYSTERLGYNWGRSSARKRDRSLGVDHFVHLALTANTPLLRHKLERGYPHAVLSFRTEGFDTVTLAALRCNTKAWRAKWQCQPVKERRDIVRMLRHHDDHRRYPSLEILVEDFLPLCHLEAILTITDEEAALISEICRMSSLRREFSIQVAPYLRPAGYAGMNLDIISEYFEACKLGQNLPSPPSLTFD